jgi:alkylhydroperoxidase/carboxymuconolactone decarboxylase family protein YurZ
VKVGRADIDAMVDVLGQIATDTSESDAGALIAAREALDDLKAACVEARDALDIQLLNHLEKGSRVVGDRTYYAADEGRWEADHGLIRREIIERAAIDPATGEICSIGAAAAARAVELCYWAFVPPSAVPTRRALDVLGLTKNQVADWVKRGRRVAVKVGSR